jgi:hypothetical protein
MSHRRDFEETLDWAVTADALDVVVSDFVLVTPDSADHPRYQTISALLERIRKGLGVDAVFVSQSVEGEPLERFKQALDDGEPMCDPLEETYGRRMLETRPRMARPRGAAKGQILPDYECVAVIGTNGAEHGTLVTRGFAVDGKPSLAEAVRSVARLVAASLESAEAANSGFAPLQVPARREYAAAAI